jgi:hypothetical protein
MPTSPNFGALPPRIPKKKPGPWFPAGHPDECSNCGWDIEEGDPIRADGEGGWECKEHGGDDD